MPSEQEIVQLPQVVELQSSVERLVAVADVMPVKDEVDERAATDMLVAIKRQLSGSEAARKALVQPLNDHVGMINTTIKDARKPLEAAEEKLKRRVAAFRQQQERERQEEIARLQAEEEARQRAEEERQAALRAEQQRIADEQAAAEAAGDVAEQERLREAEENRRRAEEMLQRDQHAPTELEVPAARPSTIQTAAGRATIRKRWVHELVDEMRVPREYLMVDDRLVRAAIGDGVREIPGIRIFPEDDVAVRSR